MVRMDRALRVAKDDDSESSKATNDPRFHVGWRHFQTERANLKNKATRFAEPAKAVVENHLKSINEVREKVRTHPEMAAHPKMDAVAAAVKSKIKEGEKVLLFCDHHATAQELTAHLAEVLPEVTASKMPSQREWKRAWNEILKKNREEYNEIPNESALRETFVKWLCADLIRNQTWGWIGEAPRADSDLAKAMSTTKGRHTSGLETVAEAAKRLYKALLDSTSSRGVLRSAKNRPKFLPGANGTSRVLGVCSPSDNEKEASLFLHNQQPDTIISIFNSPFGPDVLVVTDKLSEGIDLHRYCRHLIHYELDPSPIRTVQRNGRLRRVKSWAAVTCQPICYAYPAFQGTRDHRLVQIMKSRIDRFSLLLGGVQEIKVEEVAGSEEKWRNRVIALAKPRLASAGGQLRAREPGKKRLTEAALPVKI